MVISEQFFILFTPSVQVIHRRGAVERLIVSPWLYLCPVTVSWPHTDTHHADTLHWHTTLTHTTLTHVTLTHTTLTLAIQTQTTLTHSTLTHVTLTLTTLIRTTLIHTTLLDGVVPRPIVSLWLYPLRRVAVSTPTLTHTTHWHSPHRHRPHSVVYHEYQRLFRLPRFWPPMINIISLQAHTFRAPARCDRRTLIAVCSLMGRVQCPGSAQWAPGCWLVLNVSDTISRPVVSQSPLPDRADFQNTFRVSVRRR